MISYAQYGLSSGSPAVFVPGFGHSRLAHAPAAAGMSRVIAVDLPGIGRSDPVSGYDLLSWASDTAVMLDVLHVDRFRAVGWSWGGPYALALAKVCPERVESVALVSALTGWLAGSGRAHNVKSEFRTFGLWCRYTPFAARLFLRHQAKAFLASPEQVMANDRAGAPAADRELMDDAATHEMLLESQREAWANGPQGMYDHSRAIARPWGFEPARVDVPLHVWQGGQDPEIRPEMASEFARLTGGTLHLSPDDGHLLVFSRWDDIMSPTHGRPPAT
jgi:pimeloyl-ACP methyl ester carboxylesterase